MRKYHKTYYRPDNLCIIITGQVDVQKVFATLRPVEEKILRKGALPPMQRPWTSPVPPFVKSVDQEIEFPAEDDTTGGIVCICIRTGLPFFNIFKQHTSITSPCTSKATPTTAKSIAKNKVDTQNILYERKMTITLFALELACSLRAVALPP